MERRSGFSSPRLALRHRTAGDNPGELSGCWNDVLNMKKYIMDVHGFEEDNIVILM